MFFIRNVETVEGRAAKRRMFFIQNVETLEGRAAKRRMFFIQNVETVKSGCRKTDVLYSTFRGPGASRYQKPKKDSHNFNLHLSFS